MGDVRIVKEWHDLSALPAIERAASERYREVGYDPTSWPVSADIDLREPMAEGFLWIALFEDRVVGFAMANDLDDDWYLDELDVLPELQGRGIGRALLTRLLEEARLASRARVTLVTFRTTPWSVRLYRGVGFEEMPAAERPPYLRRFLELEREKGLPAEDRITMARALEPP